MPLEHCFRSIPALTAELVPPPPVPLHADSWHYQCPRRSRARWTAAVALTAALHLAVFFGLGRRHPGSPAKMAEPETMAVMLAMPKLKDLEEPEPVPTETHDQAIDTSFMLPTQPDLPRLALATDFVQRLDLSSLVQPDLSQLKLARIPDYGLRGGGAAGAASIFTLAELDRAPEAVLQPPPVYPMEFKREIPLVRVTVGFVVDATGAVVNVEVVDSTHAGFNQAAIAGVAKWRFRPGLIAGRKVAARIQVPIIFQVLD